MLSFTRYLAAKKSLDDRSLNRHVWESMVNAVQARETGRTLRVLEVGAGIGTMVERCVEWGLFSTLEGDLAPRRVEMTVVDDQTENIAEAFRRLPDWARRQGFDVARTERGFSFRRSNLLLSLVLEATDLFDLIARESGHSRWDLLIGQALLDTLDVPAALPRLFSLLEPRGIFFFSITFDGVTIFQPEIEPQLDELIEDLYHRTMDERVVNGKPLGESRAGRHLFHQVRAAGGEVLDFGSSDWVVFPGPDGYTEDERYFLRFMLHFVEQALSGSPELNPGQFAGWIRQRHQQIERNDLVFVAHQLDLLGRTSPPALRVHPSPTREGSLQTIAW